MAKKLCVLLCICTIICVPICACALETKVVEYKVSDVAIEASKLEMAGNSIEAMKLYKQAVEECNDGFAACRIGAMYKEGRKGVIDQNFEASLKWFLKSHDLGYPYGTFGVALAYMYGEGTNIDYQASYDAMKQVETTIIKLVDKEGTLLAEIKSLPYASFWWYTRGVGVYRDLAKARELVHLVDDANSDSAISVAEYIIRQVETAKYVEELYNMRSGSFEAFESMFKGREFAIKGLVHNIKKTNNSFVVDLIPDGHLSRNFGIDELYSDKASVAEVNKFLKDFGINPKRVIHCVFDREMERYVDRLRKGRTAIIIGFCDGTDRRDRGILMKNCDII